MTYHHNTRILCDTCNTARSPLTREQLIAMCSTWSGWCTDNGHDELGGFLLEAKHQMALDRPEGEHP